MLLNQVYECLSFIFFVKYQKMTPIFGMNLDCDIMKQVSFNNGCTPLWNLFLERMILFNALIIKPFFTLCSKYFFIKVIIDFLIFFENQFLLSNSYCPLIYLWYSNQKYSKFIASVVLPCLLLIGGQVEARYWLFSIEMCIIEYGGIWLIIIEFESFWKDTGTSLQTSF